jgi:hypothetical protein
MSTCIMQRQQYENHGPHIHAASFPAYARKACKRRQVKDAEPWHGSLMWYNNITDSTMQIDIMGGCSQREGTRLPDKNDTPRTWTLQGFVEKDPG